MMDGKDSKMSDAKQKWAVLRLALVGDAMLGRLMNTVLREQPPAYPWGDTLPLFHQADVRLCNLECALSDGGVPWSATPKVFHFRSATKNRATLTAAHIDAVSLANNHVLDFGSEGLFHTIETLNKAGIRWAGAGATLDEASAPAIWETRGTTIGLLAFTDNEPAWAATAEHPGVWYVPLALQEWRAKRLLETVRRTKERVNLLIVSAHWGPNWGSLLPAEHPPFAHALIDAGADVIFGHSSHVVRGIEVYHKKPILYCAGNFLDDYAVDEEERHDRSCLFVVEYVGTMLSRLYLYPTVIQAFQAKLAQSQEQRAIGANMQQVCTDLHTPITWNEQEERLEIALS